MLQVDSIQNYLNLKIDLALVLKAGSSGIKDLILDYFKLFKPKLVP